MLIIDLAKLSSQKLNLSLNQIGITNFDNLSLFDLIKRFKFDSNRIAKENFPHLNEYKNINIGPTIRKLKSSKKIIEAIGPINIKEKKSICFSTLLNLRQKKYLKNYIYVAKTLCKENSELSFTVWLEDRLSALKKEWDSVTTNKALKMYIHYFKNAIPSTQFLISSKIVSNGIPENFLKNFYFLEINDFLSVIPFHLRHPNLIKIFDVIHFIWECYITHQYPALYLTGINTKCHFQVFRKISKNNITAILLPIGNESFIKSYQ